MGFKITSRIDKKVYPGQIITYKVSILPGIKSNWVTEITQVKDQVFFVDEQRFGPYKMWHHEHWFKRSSSQKTLMQDKISYKVPFGFLGDVAQFLFIKRQLKSIFEYRGKVLEKNFGL